MQRRFGGAFVALAFLAMACAVGWVTREQANLRGDVQAARAEIVTLKQHEKIILDSISDATRDAAYAKRASKSAEETAATASEIAIDLTGAQFDQIKADWEAAKHRP